MGLLPDGDPPETAGVGEDGQVVIHEFSVLTDRGLSAAIATAVLATHSFGSVIARVLWGTLADRFPVRSLMGGVFLASAVGLVILLSVRTAPMAFAFAIVYGIAVGGNAVLNPMTWANYFGRGFVGTIRGVTMPAQLVSLSLGPVLAGCMFDWTGSYMIPLGVFVCTYTFGGVLILATKPPEKPQAAAALLRV